MINLNPHKYDTVEYWECELHIAKRNLELVTEAAADRMQEVTSENVVQTAVEMSEAVLFANENVWYAEESLIKAKNRQAKENENG